MLHQPLVADAQRLGTVVRTAHRLCADRREVGAIRPAVAEPAKVELEE
jgi:hypothetical protein